MSIKRVGDTYSINDSNIQPLSTNGKLIARYVHSGNTEIHPTSLDLTTGIFTVNSGGLFSSIGMKSGNAYGSLFNMHTLNTGNIPVEINPVNDYQIVCLSDTTFKLTSGSATSGVITSYPSTGNVNVDVSQWHLEINTSSPMIDLSSFNLSEIRVKMSVQRDRGGWSYFSLKGISDEYPNGWSNWIAGGQDGRETLQLYMSLWWKYIPEMKMLWGDIEYIEYVQWANNVNGSWSQGASTSNSNYNKWKPLTNFKITSVQSNFDVANGSVLEVYDLKGGY